MAASVETGGASAVSRGSASLAPSSRPAESVSYRPLLWRLLKEPLVHFLLIAAVVVAAERYYAYRQDRFRILMTADRVGQLVASYKLQFGIDAGPELREALVLKDFEDEVLYRQALAQA